MCTCLCKPTCVRSIFHPFSKFSCVRSRSIGVMQARSSVAGATSSLQNMWVQMFTHKSTHMASHTLTHMSERICAHMATHMTAHIIFTHDCEPVNRSDTGSIHRSRIHIRSVFASVGSCLYTCLYTCPHSVWKYVSMHEHVCDRMYRHVRTVLWTCV